MRDTSHGCRHQPLRARRPYGGALEVLAVTSGAATHVTKVHAPFRPRVGGHPSRRAVAHSPPPSTQPGGYGAADQIPPWGPGSMDRRNPAPAPIKATAPIAGWGVHRLVRPHSMVKASGKPDGQAPRPPWRSPPGGPEKVDALQAKYEIATGQPLPGPQLILTRGRGQRYSTGGRYHHTPPHELLVKHGTVWAHPPS